MDITNSYAAQKANESLKPFKINRRKARPHDVVIDIQFCGVCHSDIHTVRNEWRNAKFPIVPGHEIVGKVVEIGKEVTRYQIGDQVGVGCFVDSCRECSACQAGTEQYCEKGMNQTYNGVGKDGQPTYGGYSTKIVVDENYVLSIPSTLPLDKAAPLLCAGITTYSPLHHWKVKKGDKVAVVGLGGLGHIAVKIAAAMGAEVTVLSSSDKKKDDAMRLGAKKFSSTQNENTFTEYARYFDFMLNTVSANIDLNKYVGLLKQDKTMVLVGAPENPVPINVFSLITQRRGLAGSLIGGMKETQEMLNFCAEKNITSDIELISIDKINEAYERVIKGDVRYRFVIDIRSLK